MARLLIIIRPAHTRRSRRLHRWLQQALSATSWQPTWFETTADWAADRSQARALLPDHDQVLAVGGDGTLHLAVNILARQPHTLGYLPAGSGNDFARRWLGGYRRSEQLARALNGTPCAMDIGCLEQPDGCEPRYFINSAGAGLDGALVREQQQRGKTLGALDYYWRAVKLLLTCHPGCPALQADSARMRALGARPVVLLNLANNPYFGGGMVIAPHARAANGQLAWTLVEDGPWWRKLLTFPRVLWAGHQHSPMVHMGQVKQLDLTAPGWWLQADGEWVGQSPVRFGILPAAVRIRLGSPG